MTGYRSDDSSTSRRDLAAAARAVRFLESLDKIGSLREEPSSTPTTGDTTAR